MRKLGRSSGILGVNWNSIKSYWWREASSEASFGMELFSQRPVAFKVCYFLGKVHDQTLITLKTPITLRSHLFSHNVSGESMMIAEVACNSFG